MLHHDSLVRAVSKGLGKGARPVTTRPVRMLGDVFEFREEHSTNHWEWDISGGCHFPRVRELTARKEGTPETATDKDGRVGRPKLWSPIGHLTLVLSTRCRKCEVCKMHRRNEWAARAHAEFAASRRTWFGTLTVAHTNQLANERRVREACEASGVEWASLSPNERFARLVAGLGAELTKAFKRLRIGDRTKGRPPLRLRYLLVAEAHTSGGPNSGYPHWHILVHECPDSAPVLKSYLKDQFDLQGFSAWKLCEDKRYINYVCKYLAKDASTRIRASLRYGAPPLPRRGTTSSDIEVNPIMGG